MINSINEIEKLLESLEKSERLAKDGLLRQDEIRELLEGFDQNIFSLLEKDSIPYRIYEAGIKGKTLYWRESSSGFADKHDHNKLLERIDLIKKVLSELEPDFLKNREYSKTEFYFHEGEIYESKKKVFFLIRKANKSLAIIDQYLDETIYPFIDSLDPNISIKLLTGKKKSMFSTLYNNLKSKRTDLEAKSFSGCHDRFIIIDDFDIWHLGASINGLGKSAFVLKKILDDEEKKRFSSDFKEWWKNGEKF